MSSPAPQIRYTPRRRSLAGPIVLIAVGVLFLLGNFHVVTWRMLGHYWARYWPLLIILWGVIKLIEHWQDNRDGVPSRGIGVGGVFLLIILIVCGLAATSAERVNWNAVQNEMDMDSDFAGFFGNTYSFSATVEQPFTAGDSLKVVNDRGEVSIVAWDESKVKVVVNKKVIAGNEEDSRKIDQQTQPQFTRAANILTVNANTAGSGNNPVRSDLQIFVPTKAAVDVATRRGDVSVATRVGDVKISTTRGDAIAKAIQGNVTMDVRRGSVRANDIKGDVTTDGRIDDSTISDVTGRVRLTGDYFGQMSLSKIAKGVSFHSSRTDLELAALPGDLNLESGDMRARNVGGPFSVSTRSKDIHLEDISGDVKVENSNGVVEYHAGNKLGQVDISNQRGDVQVTLPPHAAFQLEAHARRGDISTDYPDIAVQTDRQDHTASGTVGKGGPQIKLMNVGGDVEVRKGGTAAGGEATPGGGPRDQGPANGGPPAAPRAPKAPNVPTERTTTTHVDVHSHEGVL